MKNKQRNTHREGTRIDIPTEEDPRLKECGLTLLGSMKRIVTTSAGSHMDRALYYYTSGADDELEYLMERMGLTDKEAVLFSVLCEKGVQKTVSLGDLGRYLGCGMLEMLLLRPSFETLVDRGLVAQHNDGKFFVPGEVLEAMSRNEAYKVEIKDFHTDESLYLELFRQFVMVSESRVSKGVFYDTLYGLLDKNSHLCFVKMMDRYRKTFKESEFVLLMAQSLLWLVKGRAWMPIADADDLLRDRDTVDSLRCSLHSGSSPLVRDGFLEPFTPKMAPGKSGFRLTPETQRELRAGGPLTDKTAGGEEKPFTLTTPESIVKRALFYNDATARQVDELALLLTEKKMRSVLKRLKRSSLRCGFTCLFHGAPGTGKTETVLQLARRTGRAVHQVDYSLMRSKWVGDSEKNVKAEFDAYRALLQRSERAPIFLLNEADALRGKRMEETERAVDKMEHAIQNIILQEMENFEGILIATTNLTGTLDSAFERRFLYKVEFESPDKETLTKIWHSMMPSLDSGETSELASRYPDFAGGQIENVTRKATVSRVLHGGATRWEDLLEMCDQEMLDSRPKHAIGFRPMAY